MKERTKFALEWERRWKEAEGDRTDMSRLCRYREAEGSLDALAERSRRPESSPTAISLEIEDKIVEARKRHPTLETTQVARTADGGEPGKADIKCARDE